MPFSDWCTPIGSAVLMNKSISLVSTSMPDTRFDTMHACLNLVSPKSQLVRVMGDSYSYRACASGHGLPAWLTGKIDILLTL